MSQAIPSYPLSSRPHLHVVGEEDRPTYDGEPARKIVAGSGVIPPEVYALCNSDAIALYAVLAQHADRKTGECWPSMKRLEACLGCTENRIRPALKRLIDAGLITVEKRKLHGMDQSNIYRISAEVRVPSDRVAVPRSRVLGTLTQGAGSPDTGYEQEPTELEPKEQEIYAPAASKPKRVMYTAEFESFWQAYPEQNGVKAKAFDQWKRLTAEDQRRVMYVIPAWKQSQRWADGYVKHAERWLRDREWEGNPPPRKKSSNPNAGGQRRWVEG